MDQEKIGMVEFTHRAIRTFRTDKSKGIHAVFSGFNSMFEKYYGLEKGSTPKYVAQMHKDGHLDEPQPRKGGVMLYLPGEGPKRDALVDQKLALITGQVATEPVKIEKFAPVVVTKRKYNKKGEEQVASKPAENGGKETIL